MDKKMTQIAQICYVFQQNRPKNHSSSNNQEVRINVICELCGTLATLRKQRILIFNFFSEFTEKKYFAETPCAKCLTDLRK